MVKYRPNKGSLDEAKKMRESLMILMKCTITFF